MGSPDTGQPKRRSWRRETRSVGRQNGGGLAATSAACLTILSKQPVVEAFAGSCMYRRFVKS